MKFKPEHLFAAAVLFCGALLRFLYLNSFSSLPLFRFPCGPDITEYWRVASALCYGYELSASEELLHAPLYPLFLAGIRTFNDSVSFVRLLQSLMVLASGLLFYAALCDLFRKGEKGFCRYVPEGFLLLFSLYPPFLMWQCDFFSENLLIVFLALAVFLLHCAQNKTGKRALLLLFAAGLASGMAVLTHPMSIFFCAGIFLCLLLRKDCRIRFSRRAVAAILFGAAAFLAVIPGSVSRSLRTGKFVPVQLNSGFNFYLGNHDGATGTCCLPPGDEWNKTHAAAAADPDGADRYFLKKVGRFVVEKPGKWIVLMVKKAVLPFTSKELTTWSDVTVLKRIAWHKYGFLFFPLIAIPALAGLLSSLSDAEFRKRSELFLILFFSFYCAQIFLLTSCRYRIPMIIPMMVFASYFLLSLPEWFREKKFVRIGGPLIASSVLVFLPLHAPMMEEEQKNAYLILSEAYIACGQHETAERILIDSYKKGDHSLAILNKLGSLELSLGHVEMACKYLSEAEKSCSDSAILGTTLLNLGQVAEIQGKEAEAVVLYQKAVEQLSPQGAAVACFNLGTIFQKKGNIVMAEKYYRTALRLDPLNPAPLRNLSIIEIDKGNLAEAKLLLNKACHLAPNDIQRKLDYAYILYMTDDLALAGKILESVRQKDPDNERAKELGELFTR